MCDFRPFELLEHRHSLLVLVHLESASLRDLGYASLTVEVRTVEIGEMVSRTYFFESRRWNTNPSTDRTKDRRHHGVTGAPKTMRIS